MFSRVATESDFELLLEIYNEHLRLYAPTMGSSGISWAEDFILGFPDRSPAWILSENETSQPFAIGNLNPSANSKRFQVDIAVRPGVERIYEVVDFFKAKASEYGEGWAFWISCNSLDEPFKNALVEHGFKVNRYFNTLRRLVTETEQPQIPAGLSTKLIDFSSDADMKIWNALRVDAFSNHFGFVARGFESFLEVMRGNPIIEISKVSVLYEGETPVGYIWVTDEMADQLIGYVANLGVAHAYQGRGYGQFLLAQAVYEYGLRGFQFVDLGVDTGNESGALRLYEKLDFKPITTWVQYEI